MRRQNPPLATLRVALAATVAALALAAPWAGPAAAVPAASTAGPGPDAPLAERAKAAKVPLMTGEAFATHTHTQLQIIIDGKPFTIPAEIGIDEAAHRITAVHTHDPSGTLHVESPKKSDHYTLGQFFTLWGMGDSKSQVCASLSGTDSCKLKVTASKARSRGLRTRLDDRDQILVDITTGR